MKRILLLVGSVILFVFLANFGHKRFSGDFGELRVALIPDTVGISDQSFNQTSYEASVEWCKENSVYFNYYLPTGDTDIERIASINAAIQNGCNVIVTPGFTFAYAVLKCAALAKDVKFICLDVSEFDFESAAKILGIKNFKLPENVFSAIYREEFAGFFAGYAAVKEGYTHLGFNGGVGVGPVVRYGYGFVKGANLAAKEMGIADKVTVEYVYSGQFFSDQQITAAMDGWYSNRDVQIIFSCGGKIWYSVAEAALKTGGKIIGVDVDQSEQMKVYDPELCLTSATKGLAPTIKAVLTAINENKWDEYSGKISNLGLVSAENPEMNYVQLPLSSWKMKKFTVNDYKILLKRIMSGEIDTDVDINVMPEVSIKVNKYPNIK